MDDFTISIDEVAKLPKGSYVFVDMRGEIAYSHGHIPDAVCWNENESTDSLQKDKTLIIYCSVGDNSIPAAKGLREQGFDAYSLKRGFREWLLAQYKGMSPDELQRYDRQIILSQIGVEGQKKLKNAKVLIVGAGGLGSPVAFYLAGAGVGTIGIMDADSVSLSNLHRQIIHTTSKLGMNKAESAKDAMEALNGLIHVKTYPFFLTPENAEEIIAEYDFVIDAADSFETKFLINDACVILKKPFCHGGVVQFTGQVMTYAPGEGVPCFRCIMEEIPKPEHAKNCSSVGVIGAAVGVIGSLQALETIKYLTGAGNLLIGRMLFFDGLSMETDIVPFEQKNPACRVCGENKNIFSVKENADEYMQRACRK